MNDLELQIQLAKLLPERLLCYNKSDHDNYTEPYWHIEWREDEQHGHFTPVLDTEWLHVCWLIEEAMDFKEKVEYASRIADEAWSEKNVPSHATWQQRARAIIKVKGAKTV